MVCHFCSVIILLPFLKAFSIGFFFVKNHNKWLDWGKGVPSGGASEGGTKLSANQGKEQLVIRMNGPIRLMEGNAEPPMW